MKGNRWTSNQNENIILEEHGDDYFCFVDREVDYVYTFHKSQIDEIIEFLEEIK